jgi:nitroreductase
MNWQEIDVYVATATGLYLYDARHHRLDPILHQDVRALTGKQTFAANAPLNLIYVADLARMGSMTMESKNFYAAVDTGAVVQNIYLYCASEGLATVVRGMIAREPWPRHETEAEQMIVLAQTVGYPENSTLTILGISSMDAWIANTIVSFI